MKYISCHVMFVLLATAQSVSLLAAADDVQTYTFASGRQVGHIDHVNILLEVSGDILMKSGSSEKPDRQELGLTYRRDYDERTLQIPTATEKTLRGVRYYREASATGRKGSMAPNPALGPESRLVAVEIVGGKETLFSPKGPFNMDELELVTAVGESLALDQLLPGKPVKIGESWKISDDTMALLLALEEITSNSVQMVLNEVTPEFARFELAGQVEGRTLRGGQPDQPEGQVPLRSPHRPDRLVRHAFEAEPRDRSGRGWPRRHRAGAGEDQPPGGLGETERCRAGRSALEADGRADA